MTSTSTLDLTTPADAPVIELRRFVKATPELLFRVHTEPEHIRNWWGPRNLELVVCEVDLRVGGTYRFVHRAPDGGEHAFHGTYREIDRPTRLSNTFVYEGAPEHEAVDTVVFEETEGGTILVGRTEFASMEARDYHLKSGMEGGMRETYERLDELVAKLS
jgi:uncharacterized protein YndB with AHSA1/START domain